MRKFSVTIQPMQGPEVSYRVGGFDWRDAKQQGVLRWQSEGDNRNTYDIASVFVEPLVEESESQTEARLLGRVS